MRYLVISDIHANLEALDAVLAAATDYDHALERRVEPRDGAIGKHRGAIVGVDECSAPSGHDHVALGQQLLQDGALDVAEVRFTLAGEDLGDAPALPPLNTVIDVLNTPADTPAERTRHAGLAGTHETHQVQLVGLHARRDSSTEKNSG